MALDGYLEIRIRDLEQQVFIGVNEAEKGRRQRILVNLWMYVAETGRHDSDDLADTVSYSEVVAGIGRLAARERHVELIETLAEEVADLALADPRVARVVVAIEKPEVYPHAAAVGVRLERRRGQPVGGG